MARKGFAEMLGVAVVAMLVVMAIAPAIAGLTALMLWIPWTCIGLGERYFAFMPEAWQQIGYWDTFWMCILVTSIKTVLGFVTVNAK